jgi:hypothetical protein
MQTFLLIGAFIAGVLVRGFVAQLQLEALRVELKQALFERDLAQKYQKQTVEAADEVVDTERRIDRAGDLPRPDRFRVLLGDARIERDPPGGSA